MKLHVNTILLLLPFFIFCTSNVFEVHGKWVFAKEETKTELNNFKKVSKITDSDIKKVIEMFDTIQPYIIFEKDSTCRLLLIEKERYGRYAYNDTSITMHIGKNNVVISLQLDKKAKTILLFPDKLLPVIFRKIE